jgi:4-hydroxybenzoyl-CoA thioesterase
MSHPSFQTQRTVRFADCDPAGIVFFPQYLVMLNTQVEQFFDEALHIPYAELIGTRRLGLPTVRLEVDFTAISRHGEQLTLTLMVKKRGQSSLALQHRVHGADGELRLAARQVLVCTSLETHASQPLPDDVRDALEPYLADTEGD